MKKDFKPKLVLIPGGAGLEGPIRRLNLEYRFPKNAPYRTLLLILTKVVLLAVIWYCTVV